MLDWNDEAKVLSKKAIWYIRRWKQAIEISGLDRLQHQQAAVEFLTTMSWPFAEGKTPARLTNSFRREICDGGDSRR